MPIRSLTRAGDRAGGVIRDFLRLQSAGGILLMPMAVIALVLANTRAEGLYQAFLDTPVEIRIDALTVAKPLVLWINDGQMAVFFFLVGLEIKRQLRTDLRQPTRNAFRFDCGNHGLGKVVISVSIDRQIGPFGGNLIGRFREMPVHAACCRGAGLKPPSSFEAIATVPVGEVPRS